MWQLYDEVAAKMPCQQSAQANRIADAHAIISRPCHIEASPSNQQSAGGPVGQAQAETSMRSTACMIWAQMLGQDLSSGKHQTDSSGPAMAKLPLARESVILPTALWRQKALLFYFACAEHAGSARRLFCVGLIGPVIDHPSSHGTNVGWSSC